MGSGQGRIAFTFCIVLIFLAAVLLPFEKPNSPQFVVLVLSLIADAITMTVVIISVRREVRQSKRDREEFLKKMDERQLRP